MNAWYTWCYCNDDKYERIYAKNEKDCKKNKFKTCKYGWVMGCFLTWNWVEGYSKGDCGKKNTINKKYCDLKKKDSCRLAERIDSWRYYSYCKCKYSKRVYYLMGYNDHHVYCKHAECMGGDFGNCWGHYRRHITFHSIFCYRKKSQTTLGIFNSKLSNNSEKIIKYYVVCNCGTDSIRYKLMSTKSKCEKKLKKSCKNGMANISKCLKNTYKHKLTYYKTVDCKSTQQQSGTCKSPDKCFEPRSIPWEQAYYSRCRCKETEKTWLMYTFTSKKDCKNSLRCKYGTIEDEWGCNKQ